MNENSETPIICSDAESPDCDPRGEKMGGGEAILGIGGRMMDFWASACVGGEHGHIYTASIRAVHDRFQNKLTLTLETDS
jgi:hypothetical protein